MAILTKSAFAKECGVAPAAITYAHKHGHVVLDEDGKIDTEHQVNANYLNAKKSGVKGSSEGGRKKRGSIGKTAKRRKHYTVPNEIDESNVDTLPEYDDVNDIPGDMLDIYHKREQIMLNREKRWSSEQKRAADLRVLVPADDVDKIVGVLSAQVKIQVLDMPRRLTARIVAMARSGQDEIEIRNFWEQETSRALERALTEMEEYAQSLEEPGTTKA